MSLNNSPWTNTQTNTHTHKRCPPKPPFQNSGLKPSNKQTDRLGNHRNSWPPTPPLLSRTRVTTLGHQYQNTGKHYPTYHTLIPKPHIPTGTIFPMYILKIHTHKPNTLRIFPVP